MAQKKAEFDQFQVRLPPGMRDQLKVEAESSGRSMNAEIVHRLSQSFDGWRIEVPDDIRELASNHSTESALAFESALMGAMRRLARQYFPSRRNAANEFVAAMEKFIIGMGESGSALPEEKIDALIRGILEDGGDDCKNALDRYKEFKKSIGKS